MSTDKAAQAAIQKAEEEYKKILEIRNSIEETLDRAFTNALLKASDNDLQELYTNKSPVIPATLKNKYADRVLAAAVQKNNPELVKAVLNSNATNSCLTITRAIITAHNNRYDEIFSLFINDPHSDFAETTLRQESNAPNDLALIKKVLATCSTLRQPFLQAVFQSAIEKDHAKRTQILIESGKVEVHRYVDDSDEMNTYLHLASAHGSVKVIPLLVEAGIDVMARNAYNKTALDRAKNDKTGDMLSLFMFTNRATRPVFAPLIKENKESPANNK